MNNETIALVANMAIALSFLAALIFGIAQVRATAHDRRERLTIQTLREFQTHEFAVLMHFLNSSNLPSTWDELLTLPPDVQANYIQFAQEMESLGILVAERLINLDLVDKTLGSFVTTCWNKYKPLFSHMRKNMPDPFLGEYFQWLAERIEERMEKRPRRPFYEK